MNGTDGATLKNLWLIRLSFLGGVLMFAAISLYVRSQTPLAGDPDTLKLLRYATYGVGALAIGWAVFVNKLREGKPEPQQVSLSIVGWAPGEGAALLGIVQHFQGGSIATLAIGIIMFAVVLILLPIPQTRT